MDGKLEMRLTFEQTHICLSITNYSVDFVVLDAFIQHRDGCVIADRVKQQVNTKSHSN